MSDGLLQSIYGPVELAPVAFAIANEGRRWLACDRLSVLEQYGRHCRLLAVSGVDLVDRRSAVCGALEELATYVALSDEPLIYPDNVSPLASELEQTIDQYVRESHARHLLALPLKMPSSAGDDSRGETIGVLIVEQFTKQVDIDSLQHQLAQVLDHFALALGHAAAREHAPLSKLSKRIQRWRQTTSRHRAGWATIAALSVALLLMASLLRVDLRVRADGVLQPAVRRDIFAFDDGVVERITVQHGDRVKEGQLLVELTQSELDYAISQLDGQLRTTQQQLEAVIARRWDATADAAAIEDENRLAAEQGRLREAIEGLQQQRQILREREEQLRICSPVAGEIVTWDVNQRLLKRPVRRGQRLLSVVDREGPWVAELNVADRDIRHVVLAQRDSEEKLLVTFILATDPVRTYRGEVLKVAEVTQGEDAPTVRVTAQLTGDEIPLKRPGATLIARIHCGKRSLAYNWFHDVWDWVRIHLWW